MNIAQNFTDWIAHYGGLAFFPLMYVNALGLPLIPAESLLFAGSILAYEGKISLDAMLAAAFAGAVLGSQTGWCIGYWGGQKFIARIAGFFRLDAQKFARFETMAKTKGLYFIIIARFIPIAREFNGLLGGSLGLGFGRFMAANLIGAVLWVLCWGFLPCFLGHILRN